MNQDVKFAVEHTALNDAEGALVEREAAAQIGAVIGARRDAMIGAGKVVSPVLSEPGRAEHTALKETEGATAGREGSGKMFARESAVQAAIARHFRGRDPLILRRRLRTDWRTRVRGMKISKQTRSSVVLAGLRFHP
jgi:hypothetical protein